MKLTIKGDKEFRLKLSRVEKKLLTREVIGKMAGKSLTLIEERTAKGKDKNDQPFKKYSVGYREFKEKRGGGWLDDTGKMLSDFTFSVVNKKRAFLHFPKADENLKASGHVLGSRILPKRDFFGLTKREGDEVLVIPEKHIKKVIDAES
ncbi:MAG: hypothetical protein KAR06_03300 [Deltaproteobacteria bacterium]|nr:hypothetical protein [Deltaproteobacteria bacterium]